LRWCSVWLIVFAESGIAPSQCSARADLFIIPSKQKSVKGQQAALRHFEAEVALFKRVADDIDPRFQRLGPWLWLAIPGVNVLSRLAELLRDGANKTTSSDRAGLPAKLRRLRFFGQRDKLKANRSKGA
jgi:hypothetical protein